MHAKGCVCQMMPTVYMVLSYFLDIFFLILRSSQMRGGYIGTQKDQETIRNTPVNLRDYEDLVFIRTKYGHMVASFLFIAAQLLLDHQRSGIRGVSWYRSCRTNGENYVKLKLMG